MSSYSWEFYAARRRVNLKNLAEEKNLKTYALFSEWCARNKIQPPDRSIYDKAVAGIFNEKQSVKVETDLKPAPTPDVGLQESKVADSKAQKKTYRPSRKSAKSVK